MKPNSLRLAQSPDSTCVHGSTNTEEATTFLAAVHCISPTSSKLYRPQLHRRPKQVFAHAYEIAMHAEINDFTSRSSALMSRSHFRLLQAKAACAMQTECLTNAVTGSLWYKKTTLAKERLLIRWQPLVYFGSGPGSRKQNFKSRCQKVEVGVQIYWMAAAESLCKETTSMQILR